MKDIVVQYIIDSCQVVSESLFFGFLILFLGGTVLLLSFLGYKKGIEWAVRLFLFEILLGMLIIAVFSRPIQPTRSYNLTPFWSYHAIQGWKDLLLIQIVMNVLSFILVGILLGASSPNIKWYLVLIIATSISLLIETLQLITKRGFSEFDDVFHNVIGCLIGYVLFLAVKHSVKTFSTERKNAS